MKENKNQLYSLQIILVCCLGILVLLVPVLFVHKKDTSFIGDYGGFISGILGTAISFVTVVLVYNTFNLQKEELKATRKEFQLQNETLKLQRFETTFFNMLGLFHKVSESLTNNDDFNKAGKLMKGVFNGHDDDKDNLYRAQQHIIYSISKQSEKIPNNDSDMDSMIEWLRIEGLGAADLLQEVNQWRVSYEEANGKDAMEKVLIEWIYEDIYTRFLQTKPSQFFRYLYNLIKFVKESYLNDKANQQKYINLIQINLSSHQLVMLFYNCLTEFATNKESGEPIFYNYLIEFNLIENVDRMLLMDENHYRFYAHPNI